MLLRLPSKVRQAFLLAQIDGLAYRDIAAHIGVSERMIKKYLAQLFCIAPFLSRTRRLAGGVTP